MKTNEHINLYLNQYLKLNESPEFAVMLNGEWGSGKSFFINKFIEEMKKEDFKFIYVSLYGITSYSEIEECFFESLHPKLASKEMKIAGKIVKSFLKTTLHFDLDGDGKKDGSIQGSLPDFKLPEYLNNLKDRILVFDDLERCSIEINNLLGYINQYIENKGQKVILLSNEKEIISKNSSSINNYFITKEKIVGKSFNITPDLDSAIESFLVKISNQKLSDYLVNEKQCIKDVFIEANYNNLRHLKQSIHELDLFSELLPSDCYNKKELINLIIKQFLAFSIELKKGTLNVEKILSELNTFDRNIERFLDENTSNFSDKKTLDKYSIFKDLSEPIPFDYYIEFFKFGISDSSKINESIKNSFFYFNEKEASWSKLWRYWDLEDNEFKKTAETVLEELKNFKYKDINIIKHVLGILLLLRSYNLIKLQKNLLLNYAKNCLNKIEEIELNKQFKDKNIFSEGMYGLGFHGKVFPEFKEFETFVKSKKEKLERKFINNDVEKYLNLMQSSFNEFIITFNNDVYCNKPFFNHVNPQVFYEYLLKLLNKDKRMIGDFFEKRYKFNDTTNLLPEKLWLKKFEKILKKHISQNKGKLSSLIIERNLSKSIAYCLEIFKESQNEQKN